MIKKWNQFIREFVENDSIIDVKMQELKDLVEGISDGQNFIYEWENKNDHQLLVNFSTGELSIRYEFDIDDLILTKVVGETIDFTENIESIDEGLDMIEKDIQMILGISESDQYSSSIKEHEVENVIKRILNFSKIGAMDNSADTEGIVEDMEKALSSFDKETIDLVIDTILFGDDSESWKEWISKEIIRVGDKVMSKYGTEPMQVLNAYDTAFNYLKRNFNWKEGEEIVEERVKSQRYKGRKIPGKYLTKNPGKMKKEIDRFVGKKEYKKDWDADYTSGKGGEGKRVKTKKSAATKAYQRMFGKKD
jgi:hypothetical protein